MKTIPDARLLRGRLQLGRSLRIFAPSLATLILIAALIGTIFLTALDWQWIAFLSGILCAAVLSLVSASWKSNWRLARRTAETARFKSLYSNEREGLRKAQESLEREKGLRRDEIQRHLKTANGLEESGRQGRASASLLATLEHELNEIAFYVDRDLVYRFHTRGFALWAHTQALHIDGHLFEEPLGAQRAGAMKAGLLDALQGKATHVEPEGNAPAERCFSATLTPHYGLPREVTGVLVRIAAATAASEPGPGAQAGAFLPPTLTGWEDPEGRVRAAIEHDGFDLHVQDIVALRAGLLPGRMQEVLIRMRDEERDLIPPGAFLPVAESCGLMGRIDRYVVAKVVGELAASGGNAPEGLPLLCVNLSRASLQDATFAAFLARQLERAGVRADGLCFEIDDADIVAAPVEAARLARELQALGCLRSLTGFGSAGKAFERVKSVPCDFVKIDGRIIFALGRDPAALAKVIAIQRVCKTIGVRTIAELVEREDTLTTLRALGVDYAQGFGLARPRPMSAASTLELHA